jgi:hypothetical protein
VSVEEQALKGFSGDWPGYEECRRILADWLERARERAGEDDAKYRMEVWQAVRILNRIRAAMAPARRDQGNPPRIWAWPKELARGETPSDWAGKDQASYIEELDAALAEYIRHVWLQHDVIDASAINALLFTELADGIENSRRGTIFGSPNWSYLFSGRSIITQVLLARVGSVFGFLGRWVVVPLLTVAFGQAGYPGLAMFALGGWLLYIAYRLFTMPTRRRLRKARHDAEGKIDAAVQSMTLAWLAANSRTINPTRLKQLVLMVEERGFVYRPVLHTLIDRAIQRDPTALATD